MGWATIFAALLAVGGLPEEPVFVVDAGRVIHRVSPLLNGACIEDVNHEIYGGLYSQVIFGESFQEPARPLPLKGFKTFGGGWRPVAGALAAEGGDGPKLLADGPVVASGEVGVEVFFPSAQAGNAGLILKVDRPGVGADRFTGYEVSLESSGRLTLGRHRQNWEPIRSVPCDVAADRWVALVVRLRPTGFEVLVDGRSVATYEDTEHPLVAGLIGLRTWQRPARFRNLWVKTGDSVAPLPFEPAAGDTFGEGVSGMWRGPCGGARPGASSRWKRKRQPFVGRQSQRVTFLDGEGAIGVENQGLNRWGLNVVADKPFEGYVWARAAKPTAVSVALESRDGGKVFATSSVDVRGDAWTRYDFTLTPRRDDRKGRFAITLKQPGSVVIGHAFLQPGDWGRFKGLPVRKDVAEGLIDQGITVLRYGGSMVNHPGYRWKKMIGPRDRRPPSPGTWYPYSTNGWGIFDFLNVCEAAGFLAIPAVNMGESPADMADFVEYANGPADSPWGRKRAADGHPEPYRLKHVELGNEEAVNEDYWRKFQPMAEAIWAKDPAIILVVGDFAYGKVIDDPFHFEGGVAVNTLAAHQKILNLAKQHGREVWFDIHIGTDHPPEPNGLRVERSYIEQLGKIAPGAKYKVVIFEYNSGNHAMKRALSNALATNEAERIGDLLPIACSANCLQPDGQNDNAWDQGLLFLNPAKVWLQPPGYVTRMARNASQPLLVESAVQGPADRLSLNAKRSEDGKTLVLQVVNWDDEAPARPAPARRVCPVADRRRGRRAGRAARRREHRGGARPHQAQTRSEWRHAAWITAVASYTFPPHSRSRSSASNKLRSCSDEILRDHASTAGRSTVDRWASMGSFLNSTRGRRRRPVQRGPARVRGVRFRILGPLPEAVYGEPGVPPRTVWFPSRVGRVGWGSGGFRVNRWVPVARSFAVAFEPVKHIAGPFDHQDYFILAVPVRVQVDRGGVHVPQVDPVEADVLGDGRRENHVDVGGLDALFEPAPPLDVRRVRQDAERDVLEPFELPGEIGEDVVADLLDPVAVGLGDFREVRAVDDQRPAGRDHGFELVHTFPGRPELGIHLGADRDDCLEGTRNALDVHLRRDRRAPARSVRLLGRAEVEPVEPFLADDQRETMPRHADHRGAVVDDRAHGSVAGADDLAVGDQGAQPVEGVDDLRPRDPGEEVLVPPREPDHLVREGRADDDQVVVLVDHLVDLDDDLARDHPSREFPHGLGGDRADRPQLPGVVPGVVEEPRSGQGGLVEGRVDPEEAIDSLDRHRPVRPERDEDVERRDAAEGPGDRADHQADRAGPRVVGDDQEDPLADEVQ